ncbi:MAG: T9SS type A sorting domain-containing protein [Bacteroidetes bacterium]|nr:T9SS type A sorting domain-containing protein [Bacteroidota bacterium]
MNPNPFDNTITVTYDNDRNELIRLYLTDVNGRILMTRYFRTEQGHNNRLLDMAEVPNNAFYILHILSEDRVIHEKILKPY